MKDTQRHKKTPPKRGFHPTGHSEELLPFSAQRSSAIVLTPISASERHGFEQPHLHSAAKLFPSAVPVAAEMNRTCVNPYACRPSVTTPRYRTQTWLGHVGLDKGCGFFFGRCRRFRLIIDEAFGFRIILEHLRMSMKLEPGSGHHSIRKRK